MAKPHELILIKLGGSVITDKDKPFSERMDVIKRVSKEIHDARKKKDFRLVVGHGGGSYPHVPALKYHVNEGVNCKESYRGIAEVQDAASRLNRKIVRELINAGENAMSIQLSSCCITEDGKIKDMFTEPIKHILDYNMVPVPYGDVAMDIKKGCSIISTEEILRFLAELLLKGGEYKNYKLSRIIMCGRVDGVFTADPQKDNSAKFIPVITPGNIDSVGNYLAESSGIEVTGGMIEKVGKVLELAEHGVETEIINALEPGRVKEALLGKRGLGTIIRRE